MRSRIALALAFTLAIFCVGDALALYSDNYRTTTVSVFGLTQHLVYRVANPLDADDGRLYIDGAGRISTYAAANVRPAAAVVDGNINVFYVDAATNDLRRTIVTAVSTPPVFTDEVFLTAAQLVAPPLAVAVDEQGAQLAVSIGNTIPEIRRWNIADTTELTAIAPVGPSVGVGEQVCYKSFNAIAYDFPNAYDLNNNPTDPASYSPSLLAYSADSCIDTNPGTCACATDFYSSVGVADLATAATGLEVSYPFNSQADNTVSYYFPAFNPFDNKEIVADEVSAAGSRVVVNTVALGLTELLPVSNPPTLGVPGWSFDGLVDFVVTDDDGVTSNLLTVTETTTTTAVTNADLPVYVLDGLRPFFASFTTSVDLLDFGVVEPGATGMADVAFLNSGNVGFDISNVALQPDSIFNFTWTDPLPITIEPGEGILISFSITSGGNNGVIAESYIFTTNWGDYPIPFTIDTGIDTGGGGTGGDSEGLLGVPHDEGEFIGPCFIDRILR